MGLELQTTSDCEVPAHGCIQNPFIFFCMCVIVYIRADDSGDVDCDKKNMIQAI